MGKGGFTYNKDGEFNKASRVAASSELESASIALMFPNCTRVVISGDTEVVRQLVSHLDGVVIEYEKPEATKFDNLD